jgi:hypothetical protein
MIMYKLFEHTNERGTYKSILRLSDSTYIPYDEANTDYQAYLAWVALGNTPLPADEGVN